jgi:DNA-binding NtrC family response regulator
LHWSDARVLSGYLNGVEKIVRLNANLRFAGAYYAAKKTQETLVLSMQKKRILLVEDDRSLQTALRYFLEDMGYEIVVAENHAQATQVIGQGPFAAAIVDYFLGNIPTSHLIAELQQRHPSMPLVCSTAASIGQIQIAEGAAPPTAYLFKPFDVSELRDTLQQVLPT